MSLLFLKRLATKYNFLLGLWFMNPVCTFAQTDKAIVGRGTAEVLIDEHLSEAQAKQKAAELARVNAIENKFGRVIFQGNSVSIENVGTGQKVQSSTRFSSISDSYVKAEWVADEKIEFDIRENDGRRFCFCTVIGRMREVKEMPVQFKAEPLMNCTDKNTCRALTFTDRATLYLYFNSPQKGYLSVFVLDNENAWCLLPYKSQTSSLYPIEANREYVLFSPANEAPEMRNAVEQYELSTEKEQEENMIYLVFSKEEFSNPAVYQLSDSQKKLHLTPQDLKQRYELPKQTSSEEFLKWLGKLRIYEPNIQVMQTAVTIKK